MPKTKTHQLLDLTEEEYGTVICALFDRRESSMSKAYDPERTARANADAKREAIRCERILIKEGYEPGFVSVRPVKMTTEEK